MSERLNCCVPFCRRTTKAGKFSEWICSVHWPMVSKETKRKRRLADRIAARADIRFRKHYDSQHGCTEAQLNRSLAALDLSRKLWARCKREAIERAAGL